MVSQSTTVRDYLLEPERSIPNNPRLPLLLYQQVLSPNQENLASAFEELFASNGWPDSWRNGVFSYHHYHSSAHEVLGCYSGSATILFGGETGVSLEMQATDAVLIPAGVSHKRLSASPDFRVVGAYPRGQQPDMNYAREEERDRAIKTIPSVPLPPDPIDGDRGAVQALWTSDRAE